MHTHAVGHIRIDAPLFASPALLTQAVPAAVGDSASPQDAKTKGDTTAAPDANAR